MTIFCPISLLISHTYRILKYYLIFYGGEGVGERERVGGGGGGVNDLA